MYTQINIIISFYKETYKRKEGVNNKKMRVVSTGKEEIGRSCLNIILSEA